MITITRETVERLTAPIASWSSFRARGVVRAYRMDGSFRVLMKKGSPRVCRDGFLCLDKEGSPFPMNVDEFLSLYEVES